MDETRSSPRGSEDRPRGLPHVLGAAWVFLAVLLVAVPVGRWASTAFVESQGYDVVEETEPPGLGLLSFLLLAVIVLPPGVLAVWAGERARRLGHPGALVVLVVAGAVTGLVLVGLPVYLARLIGWPTALVFVAGLTAVGWFSRPARWGRSAHLPHD